MISMRKLGSMASPAKSFLVLYNRRSGALQVQEFSGPDSRSRALKKRFKAERRRTDKDLEIVVVTADSLDEVKATHGRYFMTTEDLAERAVRAGLTSGSPSAS
jgi:esterase/lipase superfamily enzyme